MMSFSKNLLILVLILLLLRKSSWTALMFQWENMQTWLDSIHAKVAPLHNCWGFIDGTVRPIFRP